MLTGLRTYTELIQIPDYEGRLNYLMLHGAVGQDTFGFDRIFNQMFYRSKEWRQIRAFIVARDRGFDMGLEDYPIKGSIYVHHMNPIALKDIQEATDILLNPDYLISLSFDTHQAITYGITDRSKTFEVVERRPGDTTLWKTNQNGG